jgi:hypothetical protein
MTLEIGKQRAAPVLLLNSKPIDNFTFENCVLKTTSPVDWETPNGTVAKVNIELQMGSFFGYDPRFIAPIVWLEELTASHCIPQAPNM